MRTVFRRPTAARPAALLAALLGLLLLLASPASAAGGVDEASKALKKSQVYVDPAMTSRFSQAQADALAKRIEDADKPVFIAVLPSGPQYPPKTVAADLRAKTGITGLYGIWLGDQFKAFADRQVVSPNAATNMAGSAFRSHPGDIGATLDDFVGQATKIAKGKGVSGGGFSAALIIVPVVILALAGGGVFLLFRRAKKRREEKARAELTQLRTVVDEDITAFGEELDRLDFQPGAASADDAQRADYSKALESYEQAKQAMDAAKQPTDVTAVTEALAEGRYALAALDARRNGRALPERRPACFFDPRHGISVRDTQWAPAGGAPRTVPACQADLDRLALGADPEIRTVQTEHGREPYWNAGPAYSPWAGGYFGGGMLPALLVGTALGSVLSGPSMAYAAPAGFQGGGYDPSVEGGDETGADFITSDFGAFDGGDFGGGGDSDFGSF
ncbi:hypothetical protein CFP65_5136 [Kitasatospora sp. MMS16-BH015]|uniref:hypothetical protein n=1 Tax=Kitasatospora sp. MMS16-BH015 TaxID=2018025 RepID=UPI000CA2E7C9|nr:hypothetical protein [Kitasatospora sp. MMS16-BH015]AUG79847.1 hypothetical protein CFP65_5136 [Kitasatospora sp. MMS16-BH015]